MAKGNRRATTKGWQQVAPLVPLALFASAFTVSATDDPTVATASLESGSSIGRSDPIVVPSRAIEDRANYPVPGTVANGVDPDQEPTQVVSGLSRNGIPQAALKAYSRAQQVMSQAAPGCHLPWTLVAAIGRVESNHGRHGGNVLNADGRAVPGILGPRLDGVSTARITDTDGGTFDGDKAFDRAVGPMQFVPGTWRSMGVDGDGDGVRNPQDIDDAAMSTAVYLCSGSTNLANGGDLNRALLRYNHSQSYVDLVVSIAKAYASGSWIAVENGIRESDDQGVDRVDDRIGDPVIDPPADPLDLAIILPVQPTTSTGERTTPTPRPTATTTTTPTPDSSADGHPDRRAEQAPDDADGQADGAGSRRDRDRRRDHRRRGRQHRHRAHQGHAVLPGRDGQGDDQEPHPVPVAEVRDRLPERRHRRRRPGDPQPAVSPRHGRHPRRRHPRELTPRLARLPPPLPRRATGDATEHSPQLRGVAHSPPPFASHPPACAPIGQKFLDLWMIRLSDGRYGPCPSPAIRQNFLRLWTTGLHEVRRTPPPGRGSSARLVRVPDPPRGRRHQRPCPGRRTSGPG